MRKLVSDPKVVLLYGRVHRLDNNNSVIPSPFNGADGFADNYDW